MEFGTIRKVLKGLKANNLKLERSPGWLSDSRTTGVAIGTLAPAPRQAFMHEAGHLMLRDKKGMPFSGVQSGAKLQLQEELAANSEARNLIKRYTPKDKIKSSLDAYKPMAEKNYKTYKMTLPVDKALSKTELGIYDPKIMKLRQNIAGEITRSPQEDFYSLNTILNRRTRKLLVKADPKNRHILNKIHRSDLKDELMKTSSNKLLTIGLPVATVLGGGFALRQYVAKKEEPRRNRIEKYINEGLTKFPLISKDNTKVEVKPGLIFSNATKVHITPKTSKGVNIVDDNRFFALDQSIDFVYNNGPITGKKIFADSLYLKPEFQRKGIGTAVMNLMEDVGKKEQAKDINLLADQDGKFVWSRVPGMELSEDKKKFHERYLKWAKKENVPSISEKPMPLNTYPKKFLLSPDSEDTLFLPMHKKIASAPVKGIPDRNTYSTPKEKSKDFTYVVQKHDALRAKTHYDLRLVNPVTGVAHSWAIRNYPGPGERSLAVLQPEHTAEYATKFQGAIPEGYGAGKVSIQDKARTEIIKAEDDKITFIVYKSGTSERYSLIKPKSFEGDKDWIIINHSATRETRPNLPDSKPKYKDVPYDSIDPYEPETVLSPKLDGHHMIYVLRKGKPVDSFSYRIGKKSGGLIDHTYKSDLYNFISPITATVRGETVAVDEMGKPQPASITGALLNAGTLKSREMQEASKLRLTHNIFDVESFNDKSKKDLPYSYKLELLDQIASATPLNKVPMAFEPADKERLLTKIKNQTHPLTQEGVVRYRLSKAIPEKAKLKKDTEVEITDFFPAAVDSKYEGKGVGGFISKNVRVGSGLSDELRTDMYNQPRKYLGRYAKIQYDEQFPSGKFRSPIFRGMRDLW